MTIYDISGSIWLYDVPLTASCESVQELMRDDYVLLSWKSPQNDVIPVGAYIIYNGERYSLIEPYSPEQTTEAEWNYKPQFQSAYRGLSKVPFFMYTTVGGTTTKEAEWTLTDNAANFMSVLCSAILNETGIKYTYAVSQDLTVASATCSFNCVDIQSAINTIANAFETELWLEKFSTPDSSGHIGRLHLGKAAYGDAVDLEVGVNIKVPSVTRNGEFYNRFYVFGSSRNITQDYAGSNVNNLATKRLTLSATDYPGGYVDFSNGGQVFSKVLVFEDIYPSASDLVVMNIRSWLRYRRDEATSEKIQIGTDPETGDPVYDMYAVWFVNLKRKVNGQYVDFSFNNTTYDKDDNPTGMLLPGLVPSLHFNSGPLSGREFEVIYHENAETAKDGTDGSTFQILAGDFEIKFVEESTYIIPAVTGLIPQTDNLVILFNVMMPASYVSDAEDRLEQAALAEINRNYLNTTTLVPVDKNSYQVQSDPTVFYDADPGLTLGRRIVYTNGTYEKESRITRLVKKVDQPCYQTIVFGDEIIKGSIEELKEEAVSANRNIDILAALNKTTSELTAAYERSHQLILKQLNDQASMFLVINGAVKLNPIYAGLWAEGWLASGGVGNGGGGGGVSYLRDLTDIYHDDNGILRADGVTHAQQGDALVYHNSTVGWVAAEQSGGGTDLATVWASLTNSVADAYANTKINLSHIPDITTAKVSDIDTWISGKGYLTSADISQLSSRISALESESFFELVNGNVTLKPAYYNLWVPGWLASGDIGGGSGGSGGMDIDSELSSSSVNPVQNRVITNALGLKADASVTCFVGEIVETV